MLVVGIAGGSGSGKTTVVNAIAGQLEGYVAVIPQDSYYKDLSGLTEAEKRVHNFDCPDSIDFDLLVEQLKQLKEGKTISQPVYSYLTCCRCLDTVTVKPADLIIVEGILIYTCPELCDLIDLKIFIDADDDDRFMRILVRDIEERGKDVNWVLERYTNTVKPMHIQYIEPSKRFADVIIPHGGFNRAAVNLLVAGIKASLDNTSGSGQ